MMKQVKNLEPWGRHTWLKSVLFGITCARTFIFRRGDVESVAQGELDAARVVVLHLSEHHAVAVEREAVDGPVEEVVARQLHVKAAL